jgi:hypothetical protein
MNSSAPHVAWEKRERAVLEVPDSTTMAQIVNSAGKSLKIRKRGTSSLDSQRVELSEFYIRFLFYVAPSEFARLETILNQDGSAQWMFDRMEVTLAQVHEAKAANLLFGDPSRICLLLDEERGGTGNGVDYWGGILQLLQSPLLVYGTLSAAKDIFLGASKVVRKCRERWSVSWGTLKDYKQLFRIPRTTQEVATLLAMPEEDVPAILRFLCIEQTSDGYWRPNNRPSDKELRELVEVIDTLGHWSLSKEITSEVLRRVLGHPVGERARHAEPIVRQVLFETQ